eukprot:scaffold166929_cov20-Tisochrysis_lutea.AAC.1
MKITSSGSSNNLVPEQERMRERGHRVVIRLLLSCPNVDVNVQDKEGNAHGVCATVLPCVDINVCDKVKFVNRSVKGGNVHEDGKACALLSSPDMERAGQVACAAVMLNYEFKPAIKFGNTALFYAAKMGKTDMVEELLGHPVIDFRIRNKRGKTALDAAKRRTPIAEMLKEAARVRE